MCSGTKRNRRSLPPAIIYVLHMSGVKRINTPIGRSAYVRHIPIYSASNFCRGNKCIRSTWWCFLAIPSIYVAVSRAALSNYSRAVYIYILEGIDILWLKNHEARKRFKTHFEIRNTSRESTPYYARKRVRDFFFLYLRVLF